MLADFSLIAISSFHNYVAYHNIYHIKSIKSPRDFWRTMSKLTERGIQFSRDLSYITSSRRGDSHFVCPISLIVLCNNKVNHTLCNMLHCKHNQSKIIVLREENTK